MLLGNGEKLEFKYKKTCILSDAFEAIIAAVYIDGGMRAAKRFIYNQFDLKLLANDILFLQKDYKSSFQELIQENFHLTPRYKFIKSEGPDHNKVFEIVLEVSDNIVAVGRGYSKKAAEQNAAYISLITLNNK